MRYYDEVFDYPRAGEIWIADPGDYIGSQQGKTRPVLIVSNDKFNMYSPTVGVLPLTSNVNKRSPVHVKIEAQEVEGLYLDSIVLVESHWTLDKSQLIKRIGKSNDNYNLLIGSCLIKQYTFIQDYINVNYVARHAA